MGHKEYYIMSKSIIFHFMDNFKVSLHDIAKTSKDKILLKTTKVDKIARESFAIEFLI